jgi:hypothetical protein
MTEYINKQLGGFYQTYYLIVSIMVTGFFSDMGKKDTDIFISKIYLNVARYLSIAYCLLFAFIIYDLVPEKAILLITTIIGIYFCLLFKDWQVQA